MKHTATIIVEGLSVPVVVEIDLERIVSQMGRKAAYSVGGKSRDGHVKVSVHLEYAIQVRLARLRRRKQEQEACPHTGTVGSWVSSMGECFRCRKKGLDRPKAPSLAGQVAQPDTQE